MSEKNANIETQTPFEHLAGQRTLVTELSQNAEKLGLGESVRLLNEALLRENHPVYKLPEGADESLVKRHGDVLEKLLTLTENAEGLSKVQPTKQKIDLVQGLIDGLLADVVALEEESILVSTKELQRVITDPTLKKYREEFLTTLGIRGGDQAFSDIMEMFAKPLLSPTPADPARWKQHDLDELKKTHRDLQWMQYQTVDAFIVASILLKRDAAEFPDEPWIHTFTDEDRKKALSSMSTFILTREIYEAKLTKRVPVTPSLLGKYFVPVLSEVAEESAELLPFGKSLIRAPEYLSNMDAALRAKVLEGYKGLTQTLGTKAPALSSIAQTINKSPLGKEFWSRLLTIESPVTVLLYIAYVNGSENRMKAAMNFASFMSLSSLTGTTLSVWGRAGILRMAMAAKQAGNLRLYSMLRFMRFAPKHPVVQFAVALAVAFGLAKPIDDLTTWLDEEVIDDSPGKEATKSFLDIWGGTPIVESGQMFLEESSPFLAVDPEQDGISYISRTYLTIEADDGDFWPSLQRRRYNKMPDWNGQVQKAIDAERNPVKKKLYELETANSGSWASRQAFLYFGLVQHTGQMEAMLASEFVKRGVFKFEASFSPLVTVTEDNWTGNGSNNEAPDIVVKRTEDDPQYAFGKAREYMQTIKDSTKPEDIALMNLWKQYKEKLQDVAARTTAFSYLKIYNRSEWLGGNDVRSPKLTPKVIDGMKEQVNYQISREELFRSGQGAELALDRIFAMYFAKRDGLSHRECLRSLLQLHNLLKSDEERREFRWELQDLLQLFHAKKPDKELDVAVLPAVVASMKRYMEGTVEQRRREVFLKGYDAAVLVEPYTLEDLNRMGGVQSSRSPFDASAFRKAFDDDNKQLYALANETKDYQRLAPDGVSSLLVKWTKDDGSGKGSLLSRYMRFQEHTNFFRTYFEWRGMRYMDLPQVPQDALRTLTQSRRALRESAKIYKKMNTAERVYRAGMSQGVLSQIDANTWGMRANGTFVLLRWNKETKRMQAKTVSVQEYERGQNTQSEEYLRQAEEWAAPMKMFEHIYERKLTPMEKQIGAEVEGALSSEEWTDWDSVPENIRRQCRGVKADGPPSSSYIRTTPEYAELPPGAFRTLADVSDEYELGLDTNYIQMRLAGIFSMFPDAEPALAAEFAKSLQAEDRLPENYFQSLQLLERSATMLHRDDDDRGGAQIEQVLQQLR